IGLGIILSQLVSKIAKFRIRLIESDSRFEPANHRRCGVVCTNHELAALIGLGIILSQLVSKIAKFRIRLIESDSRFEPANHRRCGVVCTNHELAARYRGKMIVKRRPEFLKSRELKIRRHNTNDGCGFAVNSNVLSDDFGIAVEITFPNFVAENDAPSPPQLFVSGGKIASDNRRYTSDLKKIFCDVAAVITL